uniref:ABC transporter domain-containing protein n=1 Tax=Macrostomum lignano TaxID=282301 RepID=A0A1I8FPV3_9PLAT
TTLLWAPLLCARTCAFPLLFDYQAASVTDLERRRKVESVIEELGLSKVADSKIGTELIRGVSGGERKRTNIGMELITDPSVLFLDEPTTGLDAFTAGSVLRTLRNLANAGRTIVFSIHQPKYSIYRLFDNLTLVVAGRIIYHGPAGDMPLRYFANIVTKDGTAFRSTTSDIQKSPHATSAAIGQQLIERWQQCPWLIGSSSRLKRSSTSSRCEWAMAARKSHVKVKKGAWSAIRLDCGTSSIIQLVVYLFFGISIGTVFFGLDTSLESGIQNRQGCFSFLILQMVFIKERVIFIHENSSGFYRVSVYFLAKIFWRHAANQDPTSSAVHADCVLHVQTQAGRWRHHLLFLRIESGIGHLCSPAALAFFVSSSVSVFGIANIFISIIYVFMMVFGGFLMNISSMGDWLAWCKYFSVFNYAYAGLSYHGSLNSRSSVPH